MVEQDRSCIELLVQISAVIAASRSVEHVLFEAHLRGSLTECDDQHRDRAELLPELISTIERLRRPVDAR
jgi:DNA-binding FrmR family transcriptional regulator